MSYQDEFDGSNEYDEDGYESPETVERFERTPGKMSRYEAQLCRIVSEQVRAKVHTPTHKEFWMLVKQKLSEEASIERSTSELQRKHNQLRKKATSIYGKDVDERKCVKKAIGREQAIERTLTEARNAAENADDNEARLAAKITTEPIEGEEMKLAIRTK